MDTSDPLSRSVDLELPDSTPSQTRNALLRDVAREVRKQLEGAFSTTHRIRSAAKPETTCIHVRRSPLTSASVTVALSPGADPTHLEFHVRPRYLVRLTTALTVGGLGAICGVALAWESISSLGYRLLGLVLLLIALPGAAVGFVAGLALCRLMSPIVLATERPSADLADRVFDEAEPVFQSATSRLRMEVIEKSAGVE